MLSSILTHERCISFNQEMTFHTTEMDVFNAVFHRQNLVCDEADKDWIEMRVGEAAQCVFPHIVVFESKC